MSDFAIQVQNLSKRYIISHESSRSRSLRETLTQAAGKLLHRANPPSTAAPRKEEFWALKDLNFEIKAGETVAIIGPNGAGKSTLLKILSRVTAPTTGRAVIRGRVASLLEVGTGFHPELSGRENIFLNGAILGMNRAEIRRKFDAIVAFAEVEKFIDTPVKRYSSGMFTRLAFSVAAHLDCEILIVDEVLSVGDAAFQRKSLGRMTEIMEAGKTILFVSHNLSASQKLCRTGIHLNQGRMAASGSIAEAIASYMDYPTANDAKLDISQRRITPHNVKVIGGTISRSGLPCEEFLTEEKISLQIQIEVSAATTFSTELRMRDESGLPLAYGPGGLAYDQEFSVQPGVVTVEAEISGLHLASGGYAFDVALAETGIGYFDYIESAFRFKILPGAIGKRNWHFNQFVGQGSLLLPVTFRLAS